MGFYGNISDTSQTFFQFDKIFSSRKKMDQACINKTDGIYTGRFVLVKYDIEESLDRKLTFYDFLIFGYKEDINIENNILYIDHLCTKPYLYTTYSIVDNPIEENWNLYYQQSEDTKFYIKLKNKNQFQASGVTYYVADQYNEQNKDRLVGLNTICYQKDITTNLASGSFYKCIGENENHEAIWESIGDYTQYGEYLSNFQEDLQYYGNLFDYRGYDGTVWEKVYHQGVGQFIQVARLNGFMPAIEIYGDQPAELPTSIYIDAKSSPELYRFKIPTSWGFQIKEAENKLFSEQQITQPYYKYVNGVLTKDEKTIDADIYFNLCPKLRSAEQPDVLVPLSHQEYDLKDNITQNEILITPTGKSGKKYYNDNEQLETKIDMYEANIHLPIIGNTIAESYDLIYGNDGIILDETVNKIKRPRDTKWYNGTASENLKKQGDSTIGGKTYNLNTIAGNLNTIQSRLGQIIVTYKTKPDMSIIKNLSSDYIYYIEDEDTYYRIGTEYHYTPLNRNDYTYNLANVTSENYLSDTYFLDSSGNTISTSYNENAQYYKRNIIEDLYEDVTDTLMEYIPNMYYLKQGVDYIRDNNASPSFPNEQYYVIESTELLQNYFQGQYMAQTYYYLDNNNFIRDNNPNPTLNRDYYSLNLGTEIYENVYLYKPNTYYIFNNNKYSLCEYANLTEARDILGNSGYVYILDFDETIDILLSETNDDNTISTYIGHPLKKAQKIYLASMIDIPTPTSTLYLLADDFNYIQFDNIKDIINSSFTEKIKSRTYIRIREEDAILQTKLYTKGKYYYKDDNGNYKLSKDDLSAHSYYYTLNSVIPLEKNFYIPNTIYYSEIGEDDIRIDQQPWDENKIYRIKKRVFVIEDYTQRCPYGYEWNDYALYVPASITLASREEITTLIEIKGIDNGQSSINGLLLELSKCLEITNLDTRDQNTYRGILNKLKDQLYLYNKLIPDRILYVNDFGQLVSSSIKYSDLTKIMTKYNQIMAL